MKKLLFLTSSKPRTIEQSKYASSKKLASRIESLQDVSVEYALIQHLIFSFSTNDMTIRLENGKDLRDFDLVSIRRWIEEFWVGSIISDYLDGTETKLTNSEFGKLPPINKVVEAARFAEKQLPLIKTLACVNINHLCSAAAQEFGFPFILKTAEGSQGKDNYLVTSPEQLEEIRKSHQDELFVAQEFVPNTHDMRVLLFAGQPKLVIKRTRRDSSTHLNNTSAGADAELVAVDSVPADAVEVARVATEAFDLEVCGVDLVQHSESGEWFILEVNAGPDITGKFFEEKSQELSEFLKEYST